MRSMFIGGHWLASSDGRTLPVADPVDAEVVEHLPRGGTHEIDLVLSALRLAELAAAAGLPDGALNLVTGLGEEAGAALAGHPGIDFVSFTGSNEVGTLAQQAAAKSAVKLSATKTLVHHHG